MPEQYYGGAPNAFAGGMEFGAAQRARKIKENALNALIEQYGPTAADPQAALQMQRYEQSEQLHPYDVAEATRVDTARNAMVDEHGAIAGDPAAQQRDLEIEDRESALKLSAGKHAAAVLKKAKAKKGDIGAAFDFTLQALPAIGISPENLAVIRDAIVKNPDMVDEFVAMLEDPAGQKALSGGQAFYDDATNKLVFGIPMADGSMKILPGLTPATAAQAETRLAQGDTRLNQNAINLARQELERQGGKAPPGMAVWKNPDGTFGMAPIPGSQQEQELEKNLREADATDEKFIKSLGAITDHSHVVFSAAETAIKYFKDAPDGVVMQNLRRLAPTIAGIDVHEAWQSLEEIKNNVKIDEIQRMRKDSPTGAAVGSASDKDMELLGGALGRLDAIRDPKELAKRLVEIVTAYNRITTAAAADAEAAKARIQNRPRKQTQPKPGGPSDDELLNKYAPVR